MAWIIVIRDTRTDRTTDLDFLSFDTKEEAQRLCDVRNTIAAPNRYLNYECKEVTGG